MAITSFLNRGGGGTQTVLPAMPAAAADLYETAAANTEVIVIIAAVAGNPVYIRKVAWSYNGTPAGGALVIQEGATTIFSVDITAGGPGELDVNLKIAAGSNAVIALTAGGGTVVGKLNVNAYRLT